MENFDDIYVRDAWFGSRESHLLERHADLLGNGTRVLDIGAGQGRNALPLARHGCRLTAIDTSAVAVSTIRQQAMLEGLSLDVHQQSCLDFEPDEPFDVLLCFGLMQILDPRAAASLVSRLQTWLKPGGALFLTAWHVDDPAFPELCETWDRLGLRAFRSPDGARYRLFLGRGEILQLFFRWQILHHWEGLGEPHRHGDGPVERHGDVEVVLLKPQPNAD